MNTEFQNLPNVVSPKEVQTHFGISRSTTCTGKSNTNKY